MDAWQRDDRQTEVSRGSGKIHQWISMYAVCMYYVSIYACMYICVNELINELMYV